MDITVTTEQGRVPVTIVKPHGDIDASNYAELVEKVEGLFQAGAKDFVLDLSDVPFISSAGLAAIHSIANTLRGEKAINTEAGWQALKSMDRSRASGMQEHFKLLSPQENVSDTFDKVGFKLFLEIFTDVQKAVASF